MEMYTLSNIAKFLIEMFEFLPSLHRNRKSIFQEETLNVGGNVGIRRLTAGIWNILGMSGDEVRTKETGRASNTALPSVSTLFLGNVDFQTR